MSKLDIVSELVSQGLVKGSKEYNREYRKLYQRLRRKNPEVQLKERESWKKYYQKKGKRWNAGRAKAWRQEHPEQWKALMQRASEKGLHKRFYKKNREKVLEEKKLYGKKQRRKNPTFGLREEIAKAKRSGDIRELAAKLKLAIAKLDD